MAPKPFIVSSLHPYPLPLPMSPVSPFPLSESKTNLKPTPSEPPHHRLRLPHPPSLFLHHHTQDCIIRSSRVIKRKPAEQSFPALIFNSFDTIINSFIDPPIKPSVDPKYVLSDNFSPVDELPPPECDFVEGSLPPCLDGAYIRNGPNPQFLPRGPYHLFDGDGMLPSILISQGKATLCSRYVKTYKYNVENQAGCPLFPNVFSGF